MASAALSGSQTARLFVVCDDGQTLFSMLDKHPNRATSLTVAVPKTSEGPPQFITEKKGELEAKGVSVVYDVDIATLHTSSNPTLAGKRFEKIHFSCPPFEEKKQVQLAQMVSLFFQSVTQMQKTDDRVYLTLPQPVETGPKFQARYGLYPATYDNGYLCYSIRKVDSERYPQYISGEGAQPLGEFEFVKGRWPEPLRVRSRVRQNDQGEYYFREIDQESPGSSDFEEEEPKA